MSLLKTPKGDKEELLYYKGVYQIRELVAARLELMNDISRIDKDLAKIVVDLKPYISWAELGEMLGMSEVQAKTYLSPLMGEITSKQ